MQHRVLSVVMPAAVRTASAARQAPLLVAALVLLACSDRVPSVEPVRTTPPIDVPVLAVVRGTVDLAAGTMTFEQLAGPAMPTGERGVRAQIYGNQNVTVRISNTTVTTSVTGAKRRYSGNVSVRNLLSHSIGDEQAGATPADTIGIFVFVSNGPTVLSTSSACPACTVTPINHNGTHTFDQPGRRYWHWQERLSAAGGGSDTTRTRRTWTFEADTAVTNFTFDVMVSAAWPPPNETSWKVDFTGDSIPYSTADPRWRRMTSGATTLTLSSPSTGIITSTAPDQGYHYFVRRDSLRTTTSAYVEARFRRNILQGNPETSFGIDDDTRFIAVGVNDVKLGFLKADYSFLGNQYESTTGTFHTYRIQKFGADSVQLWLDGTRMETRAYATFDASINTTIPSFIYFGNPGTGNPARSSGGTSSSWDWVTYEIGRSAP